MTPELKSALDDERNDGDFQVLEIAYIQAGEKIDNLVAGGEDEGKAATKLIMKAVNKDWFTETEVLQFRSMVASIATVGKVENLHALQYYTGIAVAEIEDVARRYEHNDYPLRFHLDDGIVEVRAEMPGYFPDSPTRTDWDESQLSNSH